MMSNIPHLSILVPTIRPQNLIKYFNSVVSACKRYSFEVIFVSPYALPEPLMKDSRVVYVRSFANPTVCLNMAASIARSEFLMNSTDDGKFEENSLDEALDIFPKIGVSDIVNFVYEEGSLDADTLEPLGAASTSNQPESYWTAAHHPALRLPGINPNWKLALHFIMRRKFFEYLGYLDTRFSYVNMNLHVMAFTAQQFGSKIYNTPRVGFRCSHIPGRSLDHFAVHDSHVEELPIFNKIYSQPNSPVRLDKESWKSLPCVWERRFSNVSK